jgi:hypothetical protein
LRFGQTETNQTVVGVFERRWQAVDCLRALEEAGFEPEQLGIAGREVAAMAPLAGDRAEADSAVAGTAAGSVAGGVLGGVLGGIVAGLVPGVGPIVPTGVVAGFVAGAPVGAALGGLAAGLRDAGAPARVAASYEDEVYGGHFLVSVASSHPDEAARIIGEEGGWVEGRLSRAVSRLTGDEPEPPDLVEGRFTDRHFAELAAQQLSEAYPDREVTIDRWGRRVRVAAREPRIA